MSISTSPEDRRLKGPYNNLPQSIIKRFNNQPGLVRVTPETCTAAIEVLRIDGVVYTSYTRARNKDRVQIFHWWRPSAEEAIGIAHVGKRAQGCSELPLKVPGF